MSSEVARLLQPIQLGTLSLRNRVVMAPMTRERSPGGIPGPDVVAYYRRRAAGGVAMIITEGTAPDEIGAFGAAIPRLNNDSAAAWRSIVQAVHEEGACLVPQLWHVGAFEPSLVGMTDTLRASSRVSPSGLAATNHPMGRAMLQADIDAAIDAFASSAALAQRLGCDGVEIHGAHGYLLDQFFWSATNRRDDHYGGGLQERGRFAVELVQECRRRVGASFPIMLRFSQWKQLDYEAKLFASPAELEEFLRPLVDAGVDLFHCSTRRFWDPAFADSDLTLAGWTRKLSGRPTIAVGSVTLGNDFKSAQGKQFAAIDQDAIERLNAFLDRGEFDLVAVGRALLANPDWVRTVAEQGANALRPFSRDMLDNFH
ncbi:12-oxophytodienoate reductase [Steroidobacter sp.]|uniref:oxidoreductase n=1 Tax=Steroidobacter sp. TaxID=1978227 RepID=UPI001A524DB0|nr:12-oxophytodienoate reductase [Steroidobacter sp.]MBL8266978.1 12-oxophytodienoate reductase [Steroidobacter sp.]